MKRTIITTGLAVLLTSLSVSHVSATAYTWSAGTFSGWRNAGSWSPASPVPDFDTPAGDTFFAGAGALIQVNTNNAATFGAQLTIDTDAHFRVTEADTATDLHLSGGRIRKGTNFPRVLSGNVFVDSDSILDSSFGGGNILVMSNTFHGTANLEVQGHDDAGASVGAINNLAITRLNADSSTTYSGNWDVTSGILQLNNAGALGDGTGSLSVATGANVEYLLASLTNVTVDQLLLNGEPFVAGVYDITQAHSSINSVSVDFSDFFIGTSGETITVTFEPATIPEPGTFLLLGPGVLGLVRQTRRRRRRT